MNRHLEDLNPLIIGEEVCSPGHRYGPAIREYTLIHFVVEGCGTFYRGGHQYHIHAGEAFLILPEEVTTYCASEENPWIYQWVGFNGALAKKFETLPPVFSYTRNWAGEMLACYDNDGVSEYRITSILFQMYAELFSTEHPKSHYVRRVKDYINALYMQDLHVEEIAERMNLDRRYLSRLFKEKTGQTIQEYLISVRMEAAKKQLVRGASVAEAAQLCGYDDVCNFSKMFKRLFDISPGRWKSKDK